MAKDEVRPAFGAVVDTLEMYRLNGILDYGDRFRHLASTCQSLVEQVREVGLQFSERVGSIAAALLPRLHLPAPCGAGEILLVALPCCCSEVHRSGTARRRRCCRACRRGLRAPAELR